jgi:hypothetical protein
LCRGSEQEDFSKLDVQRKGPRKTESQLGSADSTSQGKLSLLPSEGEAIKIRATLQE